MFLLKFNIVGTLFIFYLFSLRPDQSLVDYKYSSASHFLFLMIMMYFNLLYAFRFKKNYFLMVKITLKNWSRAWLIPFLIISIGLLNSYINTSYDSIYLFLKILFIYFYSLTFCLAFSNFKSIPIIIFSKIFALIAVSITLTNFILYISSILFDINIVTSVLAIHLKNILLMPPIEGIFGPISTVFLATYTLLYFHLNISKKYYFFRYIFMIISIFIIISSVKRSVILWFIFLILMYTNKQNILRNFIIGLMLSLIIFNFDNIDILNNLITGGDIRNNIMDSRSHSLDALKDALSRFPLFGNGLDFSNKNYNLLFSENSNADNTYVSYFLDFGFFGLFLFLLFYFFILKSSKNISNLTKYNCIYLYAVMLFCSSLTEDIFNYPSGNFIIFSIFVSCIIIFYSKLPIYEKY